MSAASHYSQTVQLGATAEGLAFKSARLLNKPCQICLSGDEDHCKMLASQERAAFLDIRDANYTLTRVEWYSYFSGSPSGTTTDVWSARASMRIRQVQPQTQATSETRHGSQSQSVQVVRGDIPPIPENYPEDL